MRVVVKGPRLDEAPTGPAATEVFDLADDSLRQRRRDVRTYVPCGWVVIAIVRIGRLGAIDAGGPIGSHALLGLVGVPFLGLAVLGLYLTFTERDPSGRAGRLGSDGLPFQKDSEPHLMERPRFLPRSHAVRSLFHSSPSSKLPACSPAATTHLPSPIHRRNPPFRW